jgi:hypothetical protein
MTAMLRIMCLSVAMLAAPAMAQADPHAGHHPADPAKAPAAPAAAEPSAQPGCAMMGTQAPAAGGSQPQGGMPTKGASGQGMMSGGMSDMMKNCMAEHASPAAEHSHGN